MLSKVISKTKVAFFTASLLAIFSSCSQEGDTSSIPIATTGDVTVSTGSRLSVSYTHLTLPTNREV